jgi:hypothetical protein
MVSVRATAGAVLAAVVYAAMWLGYRQGWAWLSIGDCSSLTALHDAGVKHPGWLRFCALNVHYPSDVLAGWALGYLYVALCAQLIRPSAPRAAAALRDPF